jgi:hypothetical protein
MKKKLSTPEGVILGEGITGINYGVVYGIGVLRVCMLKNKHKHKIGAKYKKTSIMSDYFNIVFSTEESVLELIETLKEIHHKMKKVSYERDNPVGHSDKRRKIRKQDEKR